MNILDRAGEIPVAECYTGENPDFIRECIDIIDQAKSTSWGLLHEQKVVATLLRAWYDASSAASAGVDEDEVAELRNKLKGANMARGRLEKQVETLKDHIEELSRESDS